MPEDASSIKAVVFFFHGYGGHNSYISKLWYGKYLSERGMAVVMPDLVGHGYSEGTRAYVNSWQHWIDDHRMLIGLVCDAAATAAANGTEFNLGFTEQQRSALARVPYFLTGESLGGAQAIALGLRLQDEEAGVARRFAGACVIAPGIKGNPPPKPVVAALRYLIAPLVPYREIPKALDSVFLPEKAWLRPEDREGCLQDGWGSLGWGKQMRFRMGLNMLDQAQYVESSLHKVRFPFLSLHDPEDVIVLYEGSQLLSEKAATPPDEGGAPSRSRELQPMKGCLHDMLTNACLLVSERVHDWIDHRVALAAAAAGNNGGESSAENGSGSSGAAAAAEDVTPELAAAAAATD
ncbi:Alpha/Beta hydrolase protein [Tribonema minus]|uniref:Alpha/Beta hydrolase protein n=1 Tax=Tribonema minus TaxID=303371 RepID=A0A836C8U6_9STRA|nr:Alpha/Beta hydrolase protein [Tribonema minus]